MIFIARRALHATYTLQWWPSLRSIRTLIATNLKTGLCRDIKLLSEKTFRARGPYEIPWHIGEIFCNRFFRLIYKKRSDCTGKYGHIESVFGNGRRPEALENASISFNENKPLFTPLSFCRPLYIILMFNKSPSLIRNSIKICSRSFTF